MITLTVVYLTILTSEVILSVTNAYSKNTHPLSKDLGSSVEGNETNNYNLHSEMSLKYLPLGI